VFVPLMLILLIFLWFWPKGNPPGEKITKRASATGISSC
jgi:hypothetical protein